MENKCNDVNQKDELIISMNENKEKDNPETEFTEKRKEQAGKRRTFFSSIIVIEALLIAGFSYFIYEFDIQKRVVREFEFRNKNSISTPKGIYTGEVDFGYFDGTGEFIYDTGTVYEGEWTKNKIEGLGNLKVPQEGTYEGEFLKGEKSGIGSFLWDDGDTYSGEWKEDQMYGQGIYVTADGIKYEGSFSKNKFRKGNCTFENETGKYAVSFSNYDIDKIEIVYLDGTTYSGTCTESGISGVGTMIFSNKDEYTGELVNDKRNGKGIYRWQSGASYDGEWADDEMQGTGTYTYSKGNYATGTFQKNIFNEGKYHVENDFGVYDFVIKNGTPLSVNMTLANGTTYSGSMKNGKLNGNAQIIYGNGDKYSGGVVNNQKSGQGTYEWSNGATYQGEWLEDKMNGQGEYKYAPNEGGYQLTGTFQGGKPEGECIYFETETTQFKTDWSNGYCVKVYE